MKNNKSRTRLLIIFAVIAAALTLLAGCAGDAEIGRIEQGTVPVRATIEWPERSRAVGAPSAALSARITVLEAAPGGGDVVFVVNRGGVAEAFTQTYTSLQEAQVGTWQFLIEFFAQEDAQGALVGSASGVVNLSQANQNLGTVTTESEIQSVFVLDSQELDVEERRALQFQAIDADGNLVAVTEGSATWRVISGETHLLFENGEAVGLSPGQATVTATVNGIVSEPKVVTVKGGSVVTGLILFQRDDELWLINADGTDERLIFTPREGITDLHTPDLHPTEQKVLFKALSRSGAVELYEFDYASDVLKNLTQTYSLIQSAPMSATRNPAYGVQTFEGDRIYFDYRPFSQADTTTFIRADGTQGGSNFGVQPTALGDMTVTSGYRGDAFDARLNLSYSATSTISVEGRRFEYPSLVNSLEGVDLAWQDQDGQIWVAERVTIAGNGAPAASGIKTITTGGFYQKPFLSPDGRFLVAEKHTESGTLLVVMKSDGTEERILTTGIDPSWR